MYVNIMTESPNEGGGGAKNVHAFKEAAKAFYAFEGGTVKIVTSLEHFNAIIVDISLTIKLCPCISIYHS